MGLRRRYPKVGEIKDKMQIGRAQISFENRASEWGHCLHVYSKVGPNRNSTTQFRGVELDRKEA